jgi:hypothetical protein
VGLVDGRAPSSASRTFIFGSTRPAFISMLSLSTISAGVFLGATIPNHEAARSPASTCCTPPLAAMGRRLWTSWADRCRSYFGSPLASVEYVRAKKLRALAVTTATRLPVLPDVPTMGEFLWGLLFRLFLALLSQISTITGHCTRRFYGLNCNFGSGGRTVLGGHFPCPEVAPLSWTPDLLSLRSPQWQKSTHVMRRNSAGR